MRKVRLTPGEFYHLYNRGTNKQDIFKDRRDWSRFIFLILHLQSPLNMSNISRAVSGFTRNGRFGIARGTKEKIAKSKKVELVNFCLMPNHFHLLVKEKTEGGISKYMQRLLNGYTKYFNTKYQRIGHLFQGPFQAVHVDNNPQLLYLSSYIHRNPRDLKEWCGKESEYPWSSYQDFTRENRWEKLLATDILLEQFENSEYYKDFIETSAAKIGAELDAETTLDSE